MSCQRFREVSDIAMQTRPAIERLWHRWKTLTPEQKDDAIHDLMLRVGDGIDELDYLYFDDYVYELQYVLEYLERAIERQEVS